MATMTLPARLPSVALGITFVANHASAAGLPPKRVAEIELVVEEALVNICHYAYRNKVGNVEVRCNRDGTRQFHIEIIDAGEAVQHPDPAAPGPDGHSRSASRRRPRSFAHPVSRG